MYYHQNSAPIFCTRKNAYARGSHCTAPLIIECFGHMAPYSLVNQTIICQDITNTNLSLICALTGIISISFPVSFSNKSAFNLRGRPNYKSLLKSHILRAQLSVKGIWTIWRHAQMNGAKGVWRCFRARHSKYNVPLKFIFWFCVTQNSVLITHPGIFTDD